jgi:hypothetical protein
MFSKVGSGGIFRAIRARAHAELHVRVNLVAPWAMKTPMTAPILKQMAKFGIEEGKGITFVEYDMLTQAVVRIFGSANAVVSEGAVDVGDNVEGGYGVGTLPCVDEIEEGGGALSLRLMKRPKWNGSTTLGTCESNHFRVTRIMA